MTEPADLTPSNREEILRLARERIQQMGPVRRRPVERIGELTALIERFWLLPGNTDMRLSQMLYHLHGSLNQARHKRGLGDYPFYAIEDRTLATMLTMMLDEGVSMAEVGEVLLYGPFRDG